MNYYYYPREVQMIFLFHVKHSVGRQNFCPGRVLQLGFILSLPLRVTVSWVAMVATGY